MADTKVMLSCSPGVAVPVTTAVDRLQLPEAVGCIGGYDTCALLLRTPETAVRVAACLSALREQHSPRLGGRRPVSASK